jgi:hypothetical protein
MSRYHYWQFIVNQVGQPIENVNVYLYKAGTEEPIRIYTSESGGDYVETMPQVITNRAGYFEFWIQADKEEVDGYALTQKFKIEWEREGIISGSIDNMNIFPVIDKGEFIPPGGAKYQILAKSSDDDYDTRWVFVGAEDEGLNIGDMNKEVYDPDGIENDAFDVDYMKESATRVFFTPAERSILISHVNDEQIHALLLDDYYDNPEAYPEIEGDKIVWSAFKITETIENIRFEDLNNVEFLNLGDKDTVIYNEEEQKWDSIPFNHNLLDGLQGGDEENGYFHLTELAHSFLWEQDQLLTTDADAVFNSLIALEGVQIGNDPEEASADKVGTMRYRSGDGYSYLEVCMQTDNDVYEWIVIKSFTWEHEDIT